ncbi:hypothetical protein BH10BAC2_BH10BAC2_40880 [soil metagenome]
MKQKLNYASSVTLLYLLLVLTGCKKEITESSENSSSVNSIDANTKNECQCQFTHLIIEGFDHSFHYNQKGLADEWKIDYGYGVHDIYTMEYDNNNRLSKAWYHYYGELTATIDFVWQGNLIIKEHWDYSGFIFDVINIYDGKGQMIKRKSGDGYSAATKFSPIGNTPKVDIFFNGTLVQRSEYTYTQPNRNAFLAIRGIPYGFPFVAFTFSKWWETGDKTTAYDNGVPIVLWDYDPVQTVIQSGFQNYPSLITYYDRISSSYLTYGFEYQNCGLEDIIAPGIANSSASPLIKESSKVKKMPPLKMGPPELIKKQIEKMKRQYLK